MLTDDLEDDFEPKFDYSSTWYAVSGEDCRVGPLMREEAVLFAQAHPDLKWSIVQDFEQSEIDSWGSDEPEELRFD